MSSEEGNVGNFNCLVYCENVDDIGGPRPLPAQTKLIHTGNLAQPAQPSREAIHGSFVMDHRVFLKKFMLPQLQKLCLANELHIVKPELDSSGSGEDWLRPQYSLGRQPEHVPSDQHRSSSSDHYAFKQGTDTNEFLWEVSNKQSNRGDPHLFDPTARYCDYNIVADCKVEVTWTAGESFLTVKGTILYDFHVRWAMDKGMTVNIKEI